MNTKTKAIIGIAALLSIPLMLWSADYTVPKTWTRTGAEYAKVATLIFDPLNTDVPVEVRVRVKTVDGERIDIWTAQTVGWLPDNIIVNNVVTTNVFKVRMAAMFTRIDCVRAYNWSLLEGREASMVPIVPLPPPEPPQE